MDSILFGRAVDSPLDEHGLLQAERLGRSLASHSEPLIQASPRRRTQQTAAAIAAQHAAPVHTSEAIDEIDFGRWAGSSFETLQADPQWRHWNEHRSDAHTPAGVTIADVQERVLKHLRDLSRSHPARNIVIVTHAEIIRALVMHCLVIPVDCHDRVEILPASMTRLYLEEGGARVGAVSECPAS